MSKKNIKVGLQYYPRYSANNAEKNMKLNKRKFNEGIKASVILLIRLYV